MRIMSYKKLMREKRKEKRKEKRRKDKVIRKLEKERSSVKSLATNMLFGALLVFNNLFRPLENKKKYFNKDSIVSSLYRGGK